MGILSDQSAQPVASLCLCRVCMLTGTSWVHHSSLPAVTMRSSPAQHLCPRKAMGPAALQAHARWSSSRRCVLCFRHLPHMQHSTQQGRHKGGHLLWMELLQSPTDHPGRQAPAPVERADWACHQTGIAGPPQAGLQRPCWAAAVPASPPWLQTDLHKLAFSSASFRKLAVHAQVLQLCRTKLFVAPAGFSSWPFHTILACRTVLLIKYASLVLMLVGQPKYG